MRIAVRAPLDVYIMWYTENARSMLRVRVKAAREQRAEEATKRCFNLPNRCS